MRSKFFDFYIEPITGLNVGVEWVDNFVAGGDIEGFYIVIDFFVLRFLLSFIKEEE
jgi:hypothetical protein